MAKALPSFTNWSFFFEQDVLKEGLKTYFAKYSFKNTVKNDFITEMGNAAKKLGLLEVV